MAKLISKTYGEALYELAVEENKVDLLLEEVQTVRTVIADDEQLSAFMNHPRIDKEEKLKLIEASFKGRVCDELTGFLCLIVEKGRFREILPVLDYFIDAVKELKNIGVAYVETAIEMNESRKKQIEKRLLETTSYTSMEMHFSVDESLIGGMVIRIKDRVVDRSVKTKLYELMKDLQKIQLK